MINFTLIALATSMVVNLNTLTTSQSNISLMSQKKMSLETRYSVPAVNEVMKYNILLTLKYMDSALDIQKPFRTEFTLSPGQTFAFHDNVADQYKTGLAKTTNAHFGAHEGFKSDGYLIGDGVCHLASLIYWAAKDAGLEAKAPVSHDFAIIPEVPREYGVSIYVAQDQSVGQLQNLYVTNNKDSRAIFEFVFDGHDLELNVKTS